MLKCSLTSAEVLHEPAEMKSGAQDFKCVRNDAEILFSADDG